MINLFGTNGNTFLSPKRGLILFNQKPLLDNEYNKILIENLEIEEIVLRPGTEIFSAKFNTNESNIKIIFRVKVAENLIFLELNKENNYKSSTIYSEFDVNSLEGWIDFYIDNQLKTTLNIFETVNRTYGSLSIGVLGIKNGPITTGTSYNGSPMYHTLYTNIYMDYTNAPMLKDIICTDKNKIVYSNKEYFPFSICNHSYDIGYFNFELSTWAQIEGWRSTSEDEVDFPEGSTVVDSDSKGFMLNGTSTNYNNMFSYDTIGLDDRFFWPSSDNGITSTLLFAESGVLNLSLSPKTFGNYYYPSNVSSELTYFTIGNGSTNLCTFKHYFEEYLPENDIEYTLINQPISLN